RGSQGTKPGASSIDLCGNGRPSTSPMHLPSLASLAPTEESTSLRALPVLLGNNNKNNNNNKAAEGSRHEGLTFITRYLDDMPSFEAMGLNPDLLRGCHYSMGPLNAVQQRALLPILRGRDVMIQSGRKMGKSTVAVLGALQFVEPSVRKPQVLIITYSPRKAMQSKFLCENLGRHMNVEAHYAHVNVNVGGEQDAVESLRAHVVCGAPAQIQGNLDKGSLHLGQVKVVVLDGVDEILEGGWEDNVRGIFKRLACTTQVVCLSMELPEQVQGAPDDA
ncbi:unnamed protein product, partial [Polarella glacialis]